jgi:glycogen debranching enzyme
MEKMRSDSEYMKYFQPFISSEDKQQEEDDAKSIFKDAKKNNLSFFLDEDVGKESIESMIDALIRLMIYTNRTSVEEMAPESVEQFINDRFRKLNQYVQQDKSMEVIKLICTYAPRKRRILTSYSDLDELLTLIEVHGKEIVLKWYNDVDIEIIFEKRAYTFKQVERLEKIYTAICALKEIAFIKSRPKDLMDMQLIGSILRLQRLVLSANIWQRNILENSEISNFQISKKGFENIQMRWYSLNVLKASSIELADGAWSNEKEDDEKQFHDEMAEYLYDVQKEELKALIEGYNKKFRKSKKCYAKSDAEKDVYAQKMTDEFLLKTIRNAILPLAKKYGRVWGLKGLRRK